MRIRSIKPEFYRDEITGAMVCEVALFYLGLCGFADDAGCFEWNPVLLKADLDPYGAKWGDIAGIERQLTNLETLRRIARYEVAGKRFGRILSFRSHQRPKTPSYRCPRPVSEVLPKCFGNDGEAIPPVYGDGEGSGEGSVDGGGDGADLKSPPLPADESPTVLVLPCVGEGPKEYAVTKAAIEAWRDAYPGLDPVNEAKRMRLWLDANPSKRKTHRGMPRFITNWLGRSQDRGGGGSAPAARVIAGSGSWAGKSEEDTKW